MNETLADRIASRRVFVLDGAMGTMLYAHGVFVNVCYDELNLSQPHLVQDVHQAYLKAGAQLIETNTFGANPIKLSSYALDADTERINQAAAALAREVAADRADVLGAVGPLGIRIEPLGPTSVEEAEAYFGRQIDGLLAAGVDGIILETFSDVAELHAAARAVRHRTDLPLFAQVTITEDGSTSYGTDVETVARMAPQWGVDVVGLNCSVGPAAMLDAIERMARVTDTPISVQPNAGLPRTVGDRKIYLASPDYMARYARRLIEAGARFLGGCCGTTPDHIKRIRAEVASQQPRLSHATVVAREDVIAPAGEEPIPLGERSHLGRKLAHGEFIETVELLPPRGWRHTALVERCRRLKVAGVDAVNILDTPRARARMGALPTAIIVERDVGLEPVMHYTCRDRNMLGMMSDLLGAAAAGVRNLLLVTGDAPATGPYPDATAVFDIDAIGLTNLVYRLNHSLDQGGNPLGAPTRFVIGVAANPWSVDLDLEVKRFYWKVDAGAEFAVTQPVFDPDRVDQFLARVAGFRIPLLASLWPLASVEEAELLANEVPGVYVPDHVIERMRAAQARGADAAVAEGIAIARENLERLRGTVQGVQVSAPKGRVSDALAVLDRL